MALVNDDSIADRARKLESLRMTNVSSRLTRREADHLDELAKKHRLQRGEFIRQLILDELARDSGDPPVTWNWSNYRPSAHAHEPSQTTGDRAKR